MRAIGIRNRQMALFVAGEGYRLRNVIDWRSPIISEAVGRCSVRQMIFVAGEVGGVRVHDLPP